MTQTTTAITRSKDQNARGVCPVNTIAVHKRKPQYKGKVYPNGEFTFGWDSASEKLEKHQEHKRLREIYQRVDRLMFRMAFDNVSHREQVYLVAFIMHGIATREQIASELNLANPTNPHKNDKPRIRTRGITGRARRMIRNCGYLLEKEEGKHNLAFWTITIPPLPEDFREYLMQHWGNFKRTIIQSITRRLIEHGRTGEICEVTEIQGLRLEKTKDIYLHSHLLWSNRQVRAKSRSAIRQCRKGGEWVHPIPATWLRHRTQNLLRKWATKFYAARRHGQCVLEFVSSIPAPNIRYEPVRKSVVGYLAKYMGKGGAELSELLAERGVDYRGVPRQWYYLGGGLRRRVTVLIRPFSNATADFLNWLYDIADLKGEVFVWVREVAIKHNERVFRAGLCGQLSKLGWRFIDDKIIEEEQER